MLVIKRFTNVRFRIMRKTGVGIVGCGNISDVYLKNLTELFKEVEVTHLCDVVSERASAAAGKYGICNWSADIGELLSDPAVDIVLNLGRTYDHCEITERALIAGKPVYSEKPLGITMAEGKRIIELSKKMGLPVGCAPDTFLGSAVSSCRKLIEDNIFGEIIGGSCFMVCRGHESWHPNPDYYYKAGGGPMLDMGPYYITALVSLLGRVRRVTGMVRTSFPKRVITSQPRKGQIIDVEVPTDIKGLMEFESGAVVSIYTTFDVYVSNTPYIEIYGSKGTLQLPDPDCFGGGEISLWQAKTESYEPVREIFRYRENSRGLGLADMAKAMESGRRIRANAENAFHVLEIMLGFLESSDKKRHIEMKTPYEKVPPMPIELPEGILD
jgi:predicted dehydrogenase